MPSDTTRDLVSGSTVSYVFTEMGSFGKELSINEIHITNFVKQLTGEGCSDLLCGYN